MRVRYGFGVAKPPPWANEDDWAIPKGFGVASATPFVQPRVTNHPIKSCQPTKKPKFLNLIKIKLTKEEEH